MRWLICAWCKPTIKESTKQLQQTAPFVLYREKSWPTSPVSVHNFVKPTRLHTIRCASWSRDSRRSAISASKTAGSCTMILLWLTRVYGQATLTVSLFPPPSFVLFSREKLHWHDPSGCKRPTHIMSWWFSWSPDAFTQATDTDVERCRQSVICFQVVKTAPGLRSKLQLLGTVDAGVKLRPWP